MSIAKNVDFDAKVGDRVYWGEGEDTYTGTIIKRTPKTLTMEEDENPFSGRRVKFVWEERYNKWISLGSVAYSAHSSSDLMKC